MYFYTKENYNLKFPKILFAPMHFNNTHKIQIKL